MARAFSNQKERIGKGAGAKSPGQSLNPAHLFLLTGLFFHTSKKQDLSPDQLTKWLSILRKHIDEQELKKITHQLLLQFANKDWLRLGRPGRFVLSRKGLAKLCHDLGLTVLPDVTGVRALHGLFVARALGFLPGAKLAETIETDQGLLKALFIASFHLPLKVVGANWDDVEGALKAHLFSALKEPNQISNFLPKELLRQGYQSVEQKAWPELAGLILNARGADVPALRTQIIIDFLTLPEARQALFSHMTPGLEAALARQMSLPQMVEKDQGPQSNPYTGPKFIPAPKYDQKAIIEEINNDDLADFAAVIKPLAKQVAAGWAGSRLAYISQVWDAFKIRHSNLRLTQEQFKQKLLSAHRTGHLSLATADLRDRETLKDIEQSTIKYKNSQWHFIRIEK